MYIVTCFDGKSAKKYKTAKAADTAVKKLREKNPKTNWVIIYWEGK